MLREVKGLAQGHTAGACESEAGAWLRLTQTHTMTGSL